MLEFYFLLWYDIGHLFAHVCTVWHWHTHLMMMSYWSIWDPRWLPWRTPPLPTTTHRLQLPSLSSKGGKPGWGREARASARCSSLPWSPKGGDRSQDTVLCCCTNTGISRRPAEQDRGLRWFRHHWGWQGADSREADWFNKTWIEKERDFKRLQAWFNWRSILSRDKNVEIVKNLILKVSQNADLKHYNLTY